MTVDLTGSGISNEAEFGLLIAKTEELEGNKLDFNLSNIDDVAVKVKAQTYIDQTENGFKYQVVINGIPESDYGVSLTAVPYVIDGENKLEVKSGSLTDETVIVRTDENHPEYVAPKVDTKNWF